MNLVSIGRWTVALAWLAFVSVLFFLPGSSLPKGGLLDWIFIDKAAHITIFTVLVWTWSWVFGLRGWKESAGLVWILLGYGLLVEVVQHYLVVNRSFDLTDWLADAVGCALGVWLWSYIKPGYRRVEKIKPL